MEYAEFLGQPWPEAEPVILTNFSVASAYAVSVRTERWPEFEQLLSKDAPNCVGDLLYLMGALAYALQYGYVLPEPLHETLDILAAKYGGATLVAPYALAHLKRYEHIEQLSWTSWMTETSLVEYVEQIGKRPWPSMEHAIAKDIELLRRYMQATQRPFGPDGELEVFASDEAATAYYHTLSGYRRALSGASRCCWPLHMPSILRC